MVDGIEIYTAAIRAAQPTAPIFFCFSGRGREKDDARWSGVKFDIIKAAMAKIRAIRTAGDTKVYFVPLYATVQRDIGFIRAGTADPSGVVISKSDDPTHLSLAGNNQGGEVLAQFIAFALS